MATDDSCPAELPLEGGVIARCTFRAGHSGDHGAPRPSDIDETQLRFGANVDIGMIYWENRPAS